MSDTASPSDNIDPSVLAEAIAADTANIAYLMEPWTVSGSIMIVVPCTWQGHVRERMHIVNAEWNIGLTTIGPALAACKGRRTMTWLDELADDGFLCRIDVELAADLVILHDLLSNHMIS